MDSHMEQQTDWESIRSHAGVRIIFPTKLPPPPTVPIVLPWKTVHLCTPYLAKWLSAKTLKFLRLPELEELELNIMHVGGMRSTHTFMTFLCRCPKLRLLRLIGIPFNPPSLDWWPRLEEVEILGGGNGGLITPFVTSKSLHTFHTNNLFHWKASDVRAYAENPLLNLECACPSACFRIRQRNLALKKQIDIYWKLPELWPLARLHILNQMAKGPTVQEPDAWSMVGLPVSA